MEKCQAVLVAVFFVLGTGLTVLLVWVNLLRKELQDKDAGDLASESLLSKDPEQYHATLYLVPDEPEPDPFSSFPHDDGPRAA